MVLDGALLQKRKCYNLKNILDMALQEQIDI